MTTESPWHKASVNDLPELIDHNGDVFSQELLFIVKDADYGTYYREGYFDDRLRFFARGICESYTLKDIVAWAYLPDEDELIKQLEK